MKCCLLFAVLACLLSGEELKAPARLIFISRSADGVKFNPPLVKVWAGDTIHWRNTTGELHEPGVLNEKGGFVPFQDAPIAAHSGSHIFSPMPRLNADKKQIEFEIHYHCRKHPGEQGTIKVQPTP